VIGILLQPFMPGKGAELLDMLDVSPDRRSLSYARLGADDAYGAGKDKFRHILFPPLATEH
jgi:methionyl-tRNA synthetase